MHKPLANVKRGVGYFFGALAALLAAATACGPNTNPAGIPVLPKSDAGGSASQAGSSSAPAMTVMTVMNACPGAIDLPGFFPCRSQQDCGDGICEDPNFISIGCAGSAPIDECAQDSDCSDGKLCLTQHVQCEPQMICVARCVTGSCADGQQCGADGKCAPARCGAGYTCSAGQVCRPAAKGADAHGCAVASCASDAFTCPAGSQCTASIGMDSHGCNVPRCDHGATCAQNTRCNPASPTPDGCAPLGCAQDRDCDCGVCITGTCANQPHVCVPQLL
ncbi:MAG TPA: hypothetical protein VHW01_27325 [Polyangiaceae bacterium]|nr:hypothetical protein [Polyangiaceae bacterium]